MSKKIETIIPDPEKILPIRFLFLDVDGVMTDGSISYTNEGGELKTFNVKDGSGMKYWARAGHAAGIVTGRSSPMVVRRARELDIAFVEMDARHKLPAFEKILAAAGVAPEEAAIIGDDLPDLPLIRRAGMGIAVSDAVAEVREAADYVTSAPGGRGAVREVVELILKTQGRWAKILERYLA